MPLIACVIWVRVSKGLGVQAHGCVYVYMDANMRVHVRFGGHVPRLCMNI